MNGTQKPDSLKEMLEILKGDYSYPAKLWIWGKIIKEWAGIIIGVIIFLCVFLFIIFSINWSGSRDKGENASQQETALPMKDILAFIALCQRSINERQEIFERLTKTIHLYAEQELDQASVERKLSNLSLILSRCNMARGRLIDEFAQTSNPFNVPEIAAAFDKLTENPDDFFRKNNKALNSQWENEQWGQLCTLCQNEVTATNKELSQILKSRESNQMPDQITR